MESLKPLSEYDVFVLDCDGVILDSNGIKTEALYETVGDFGDDAVARFVHYHRENGGISRYVKFEHFLRNIVHQYSEETYYKLLEKLSKIVKAKLLGASFTEGAENFIRFVQNLSKPAALYIVSGGDQDELRHVFQSRDMESAFSGIFGSPTVKTTHCDFIKAQEKSASTLFVGDSRLDHEAADYAGFDFLFLSRYTDFDQWESYCAAHQLTTCADFQQLLRDQAR